MSKFMLFIYVIYGLCIIMFLVGFYRMCIKINQTNNINVPGIPNHIPQQPIIITQEHQAIINDILKNPSEIDYDVNDTSDEYINKIKNETPKNKIFPLQLLENEPEKCMICLDPLKDGKRPLIRLSCQEHYFHYSCYQTLYADEMKKRKLEHIFGQIKNEAEMYFINCPFCRNKVVVDNIYIHYDDDIKIDMQHNEITPLITKSD